MKSMRMPLAAIFYDLVLQGQGGVAPVAPLLDPLLDLVSLSHNLLSDE